MPSTIWWTSHRWSVPILLITEDRLLQTIQWGLDGGGGGDKSRLIQFHLFLPNVNPFSWKVETEFGHWSIWRPKVRRRVESLKYFSHFPIIHTFVERLRLCSRTATRLTTRHANVHCFFWLVVSVVQKWGKERKNRNNCCWVFSRERIGCVQNYLILSWMPIAEWRKNGNVAWELHIVGS